MKNGQDRLVVSDGTGMRNGIKQVFDGIPHSVPSMTLSPSSPSSIHKPPLVRHLYFINGFKTTLTILDMGIL